MTPLARALSSALLHFLWQGLVVALVLSIALVLLRKRSARARYLASCAALAVMAVLPAITMWALWEPIQKAETPLRVPPAIASDTQVLWAGHAGVSPLFEWALPVWSLGVLFFALRLMWGSRQVSALRRCGEGADPAVIAVAATVAGRLGLARPVRVLMSAVSEGPSVVGWLRPVILLPAATLAGLTPAQFEAVLAHEIAHILRYDYLVNLLQMLVEALLFYHPAVWWVSSRIRHERELCCDDLAVRACGDAVCYARALTTLERLRASTPALAIGTTSGRLLYRIERLMGTTPEEDAPARWPGVVALAAGLACIALTTNWARGQAPAPPDQPGVKVDLGKSSVLNRTGVAYPEAAKNKGVKGHVTVQVTVDENGNVSDARVMSGPEELRKSVLQSVLTWKFAQDAARSKRQVSVAFQPPPPGTPEPVEDPEVAGVVADSEALIERVRAATRLQDAANREQRRRDLDSTLSFLEQQVAVAQREIKASEERVPKDLDSLSEAEARLKRLERQMEAAQVATQAEAARSEAMQAELQARQAGLQARRAQSQALLAQLAERNNIVGRTLKNIQMTGFTEGVTKYLTSGLKLHVGDTLTLESIEAARKTVRDYDENVTVEFIPTDDGQVELRLTEVASRR